MKLINFEFIKNKLNYSIFISKDNKIIMNIYIYNLLICKKNMNKIKKIKNYLISKFKIKDLKIIKKFLKIKIEYNKNDSIILY